MYNRSLCKKIAFLLVCIFTTIHPIRLEISKNATKNVPWNFELYNKSNNDIVFAIYTKGLLPLQPSETLSPTELKSGAKLRFATLDLSKEIIIKIWTEQNTQNSKTVFNAARSIHVYPERKQQLIRTINSVPSTFTFTINLTGRTILKVLEGVNIKVNYGTAFLTWDGNSLRPQTGTLKGLSGKTDSGLDNRNNIKLNEIIY